MIMMRENDRRPYVNDIPWFKKTRPGIRTPNEHKPVDLTASMVFATAIATDRVTAGIVMPDDVRKQRPLREVDATEDGDIFTARNAVVIMVSAILALAIYWGVAALVVATDQGGNAVNHNSSAPQEGTLVGAAVPEAKDQNRAASNQDHGAQ